MLDAIASADAAALELILALPAPEWLHRLWLLASVVATGGGVWIVLGVALAVTGRIRLHDAVVLLATIALVHVVVDVLIKPSVGRPRPEVHATSRPVSAVPPRSPSFPSGHAANAVASALVLTRRWTAHRTAVWSAAALVAVARVGLGWHYPGDAAAGALTGLLCAQLCLRTSLRFAPAPLPPGA